MFLFSKRACPHASQTCCDNITFWSAIELRHSNKLALPAHDPKLFKIFLEPKYFFDADTYQNIFWFASSFAGTIVLRLIDIISSVTSPSNQINILNFFKFWWLPFLKFSDCFVRQLNIAWSKGIWRILLKVKKVKSCPDAWKNCTELVFFKKACKKTKTLLFALIKL